jgi:hypothetical protein
MTNEREKPPRNRDQELPRRKGESIETTVPREQGKDERDRNAPLPEEDEPRDQGPAVSAYGK